MTITPTTLVRKHLHAEFVVMSKAIVDSLLALNTKNRILRPSVVETYRRAITAGIWCPTNQGIGVTASGVLADGQTRLHGLVEAGYPPVTMLVALGLPDEAIAAIDCGVNRKPQDYLHFLFDVRVSAQTSAILRTIMLARTNFADGNKIPAEMYATEFRAMAPHIDAILRIERAGKLQAAVLAAIVAAHYGGYEAEAEAFTNALATGDMLAKDNPALILRNWLSSGKGGGGTLVMVERWKKTTRALQAFIDNQPLQKLYRTKTPLASALVRERGAVVSH